MANELKAGRELDALVAEKLMGWKLHTSGQMSGWWEDHQEIFHVDPLKCSTDIAAAWEVVEKMKADGFRFTLVDDAMGWFVEIHAKDDPLLPGRGISLTTETAPLAICLAALKAAGVSCGR